MGTVIKAKRDGFRRAGLIHHVAGTFYPDGELSEQQLEVLRNDPHLLVVEGAQDDALVIDDTNAEMLLEMGITIAALEHELEQARAGLATASSDLEQARAGLKSACSDLMAALDRQKAVPGLVVGEAALLVPADPGQEGVICIQADSLAALIAAHLQPQQKTSEAQDNGNNSTLGSAGDSESPSNPAPVPAVAPAPGPDAEPVKVDKPAGKRGAGNKAEQKGND